MSYHYDIARTPDGKLYLNDMEITNDTIKLTVDGMDKEIKLLKGRIRLMSHELEDMKERLKSLLIFFK